MFIFISFLFVFCLFIFCMCFCAPDFSIACYKQFGIRMIVESVNPQEAFCFSLISRNIFYFCMCIFITL